MEVELTIGDKKELYKVRKLGSYVSMGLLGTFWSPPGVTLKAEKISNNDNQLLFNTQQNIFLQNQKNGTMLVLVGSRKLLITSLFTKHIYNNIRVNKF
jgi:hypothetical protein